VAGSATLANSVELDLATRITFLPRSVQMAYILGIYKGMGNSLVLNILNAPPQDANTL
jgi:hypothetical protein